ncbi:unnamed protein product [Mesocestoides corti]|uniref:Sacsin/Nov domain-containing protein n=1 Tax=Mesocestoides corti TaxID=53468 RepID=A0A158QUA5_MESCO|nr:unnamed protein product [Mesocestoides corti]
MPVPEPLPQTNHSSQYEPYVSYFGDISEVNGAVDHIIETLSSNGEYSGIGRVQSELFRLFPHVRPFLHDRRIHPDHIPAIIVHRQLIQHVNSLLWAYAVTHPIVTLNDLDALMEVRQIAVEGIVSATFRFSETLNRRFVSVVEMLRPESLARASKNAQNMLDTDIRQIYGTFANRVVTNEAIARLQRQKPVKALRALSRNCRDLYDDLVNWAEGKNLAWPSGFIESLLSFEKFLNSVATSGPFRSLLHLALVYSKTDNLSTDLLLSKIQKSVVINVDAESDVECGSVINLDEDKDGADAPSLAEVVERFNEFFDTFSKSVRDESVDPCVPWRILSDIEKQLKISTGKSLVALLTEASDKDFDGPKPKCLCVLPQVRDDQPQPHQQAAHGSPENDNEVSMTTSEIRRLREFLRHLTCLAERSAEALMDVATQHLNVPRTPSVKQIIHCILTDTTGSSEQRVFMIHPAEFSFLCAKNNRNVDVLMPHELFTQRSAVLRFLATCPPLCDPESWTLWSLFPGSLASHWGSLDEFIVDTVSSTEAHEKYNLAVVKLACNGYIRLTTNGSPSVLVSRLSECASSNSDLSLNSPRRLCDLLIGSALLVNRFLPPTDSIRVIGTELRMTPHEKIWNCLLRTIMLASPIPLLGVLFAKILVPALAEVSIVMEEGSGLRGLVECAVECSEKDRLVTAIGVVGGQLGWPVWMEVFKNYRLSTKAPLTEVPSCQIEFPGTCLFLPRTNSSLYDLLMLTSSCYSYCHLLQTNSGLEASEQLEKSAHTPVASSRKRAKSVRQVLPVDLPTDEQSVDTGGVGDRQDFIENLRKTEFGLGIELDVNALSLLQRFEGRLSRSLNCLSQELYGQPGHFLLELIQNADDNNYASDTTPSIDFLLADSTLVVRNNEAVGFTEADMAALCDVGVSTKVGHRDEQTGRKGIGFKSVFAVSDGPEVHSNGFHVRFQRKAGSESASVIVPEWVPTSSLDVHDDSQWRTVFKLPLSPDTCGPSARPDSLVQLARQLLTHHLILFLRRIECIFFRTDEGVSVSRNTRFAFFTGLLANTSLQSSLTFQLERKSELLFTMGGPNPSFLKLFTVTETHNQSRNSSRWLLLRHRVSVDTKKLRHLGGNSMAVKTLPKRTDVAVAIPLTSKNPLPVFPVYSFLPVRSAGFHFLLNADFDLTSSREDIDGTSVSPTDAIQLSQCEILGRVLDCLPVTSHKKAPIMGIFACLGEQIRDRLSRLSWLPVLGGIKYSPPSKVLFVPQKMLQVDKSPHPDDFLTRLLIDRLGMHELNPDFFAMSCNGEDGDELGTSCRQVERRIEKLVYLGIQPISADSIAELVSTLSAEELRRPGMLYALLANIESNLHLNYQRHLSVTNRVAWQRRFLRTLRHLPLFPLLDDRLVSLESIQEMSGSSLLKNRNHLMVPAPQPIDEGRTAATYGDYLVLLSRLGPLLSPSAIYPMECVSPELPSLLTCSVDGLGVTVAKSPLDVINYWIRPHQLDFDLNATENADWFIAAAQVMVWAGQLEDSLVSCLPIVCVGKPSPRLFHPNTDVAFPPPVLLNRYSETEENQLLSMCLETMDEGEKEDGAVLVASADYFKTAGFSLALDSLELFERWNDLFSKAGLSTLRSIHVRRYRLEEGPEDLPLLPATHPLRLSPALRKLGGRVVIEDWVCPGLEDVLLPWIERTVEQFGLHDSAKVACQKLSTVLSRNWVESFEGYTLAVAYETTANRHKPIPLGASSWVHALRTRKWLTLSSDSQVFVASTSSNSAALALDFVSTNSIYSPTAFSGSALSLDMQNMFAQACCIWKPFDDDEVALPAGLVKALGLKQHVDESTFQHLMSHLIKNGDNLPDYVTPGSLVDVYQLALQTLGGSSAETLATIFPCILVPCSSPHSTHKRSKKTSEIDLDNHESDCPACARRNAHASRTHGQKRTAVGEVRYHLVPTKLTCWQRVLLPPVPVDVGDANDDGEIDENEYPVPTLNTTSVSLPAPRVFDQRIPLCSVYGPEWKSLFCDALKVPLTSCLDEVLSLRPSPPLPNTDSSCWQASHKAFGRQLGAWYALIDFCLVVSRQDSCPPDHLDQLLSFPLLYDMSGRWQTPKDVCNSAGTATGLGVLFAWRNPDLVSLLAGSAEPPPPCLLGHSLETLEAFATSPTCVSTNPAPQELVPGKEVGTSHSLLLNVLQLPVSYKSQIFTCL